MLLLRHKFKAMRVVAVTVHCCLDGYIL